MILLLLHLFNKLRHTRQGLFASIISVILIFHSGVAISTSYERGFQLYSKGRFNEAKKSLSKALSNTRQFKLKAKIYRLIGIIDYTNGRKKEARNAFVFAKNIDPKSKINPDQVLDESVIDFYNSIKVVTKKKSSKTVNRGVRGNKAQKPTFLFVSSAVKTGQVLLNGIISGSVNSNIEAKPGLNNVTVNSPGYYPLKFKAFVKANQLNKYSAKMKRKPTKAEILAAKKAKILKKRAKLRKAQQKKEKQMLARRQRIRKRAIEQERLRGEQRRLNKLQKERKKPGRKNNLFNEPMPNYQNPQMQSPTFAQPYTPPPVYQAPQPYPYPYTQPYQQPYMPPPMVPAPAYTPYGPAAPPPIADPYIDQPSSFDNFNDRPRRSSKRGKKRRKKRQKNFATAFFPAGIPQYGHDKPLLGTLFLIGQGAGLGAYFYFGEQKNSALTNAKIDQKKIEKQIETADAERKAELSSKLDEFILSSNAYALEQDKYANYGLYAALGLWGASVLEAVLLGPAQKKFEDDWAIWRLEEELLSVGEETELADLLPQRGNNTNFSLGIQPLYQYDRVSLSISLQRTF